MNMISFRPATPDDEAAIAQLHAQSWQKHYRGIFSDVYLDQEVVQERAAVWAERFAHPASNRHIILAERAGELLGFACIEVGEDPQFGTLLDNLHVRSSEQGAGLGAQLMRQAAQRAEEDTPGLGFYLWVLAENHAARGFYDKMGGINHETLDSHHHPGGGDAAVCRYVWERATDLLNRFDN
jgi:predicted N-acetyltransferase YhbS